MNAGIPTYGINGMFSDPDGFNHGLNESVACSRCTTGAISSKASYAPT